MPAPQDKSASLGTQASRILKPKTEKPNPQNQNTQSSHHLALRPGIGREETGETRVCIHPKHAHLCLCHPPHAHTHTRSTHILAPLRMLARALGALRGGFDSQTPEKLLAENMLVTKSSQLPQISSARAGGLQVFEKLPGPWQLPPAPLTSLSGSTQNASFPRSCRLEVKIIRTVRQCPKGHGCFSHQPSGLPGAKSWEPPSQHCLTGWRQPRPPCVFHWQDLAGFAGDPDLELLGPEMLSQCRRPSWLLASPTPAFSSLSLPPLFTHC